MKVTSVTFGYTKNLGNFQSARADVTVDLADGDNPQDAMTLARAQVWLELDEPLDSDERSILSRYNV